uniref:Homeobox domain-containing protein n=1 Tax=Zonotrichia albicollis TaxID=44394 RepID=A0A8D2QDI3_ZONAL
MCVRTYKRPLPARRAHIRADPAVGHPARLSHGSGESGTGPFGRDQAQWGQAPHLLCAPSPRPQLAGQPHAAGQGQAPPEQPRAGPRRARTAFTSEQVCRLEKTFQRHKYLGATERRKLAAALQLSEIQIKTWFQNRRMKLKRQIQDHQHSLVSPVPFHSYAPGPSPALFQDGLHYPFAAQHQRLLPFTPVPAVQFSFSFPRYDASQSAYHLMANELPYYHQHLLPHPSFHPILQNKMDTQCHPVYAL